jgi:superfamily II RNA helicase
MISFMHYKEMIQQQKHSSINILQILHKKDHPILDFVPDFGGGSSPLVLSIQKDSKMISVYEGGQAMCAERDVELGKVISFSL